MLVECSYCENIEHRTIDVKKATCYTCKMKRMRARSEARKPTPSKKECTFCEQVFYSRLERKKYCSTVCAGIVASRKYKASKNKDKLA